MSFFVFFHLPKLLPPVLPILVYLSPCPMVNTSHRFERCSITHYFRQFVILYFCCSNLPPLDSSNDLSQFSSVHPALHHSVLLILCSIVYLALHSSAAPPLRLSVFRFIVCNVSPYIRSSASSALLPTVLLLLHLFILLSPVSSSFYRSMYRSIYFSVTQFHRLSVT